MALRRLFFNIYFGVLILLQSSSWADPKSGAKPRLSDAALQARQGDEDCGPSCAYGRANAYQSQSFLLLLQKRNDINKAADALVQSNPKNKKSLQNDLMSELGSFCSLIGESNALRCADQWNTMHEPILLKSRRALHGNSNSAEELKSSEGTALPSEAVGAARRTLPKYSKDPNAAKKPRFSRVNKPLTKEDFEAIYALEQKELQLAASLETERATQTRDYFKPSESDFAIFETIMNETGGTLTRPTGKIDKTAYQAALAEYERQVQLGLIPQATRELAKRVPESLKNQPKALFRQPTSSGATAATSKDEKRVGDVEGIFGKALREKLMQEGVLSVRSFPGKEAAIPDQIAVPEGATQTEYSPALADESMAESLGIQFTKKTGRRGPASTPKKIRNRSILSVPTPLDSTPELTGSGP